MRQQQHPAEHQQQRTPAKPAGELVDLLVGDWRPSEQQILQWVRIAVALGSVLLAVLLILNVIGLIFGIPPLNLLKILAIPITVGAAVPLLNWLQKKRELDVEQQRAQDDALQAYLGRLSQLLTDKEPPLDKVEQGDHLRTVARAWTLTVLDTLDSGRRKRRVLKFLYEANLICANCTIVRLSKVNLSEADLNGADLNGVDLRGTILSGADLSGTILSGANLSGAAGITNEELEQQAYSLEDATMPDGSKHP